MAVERRVWTVDAFSPEPLRGNPAAVVLDAEGLEPGRMQRLAAEFNLSETVFLLPASRPDADYAVRIFTPRAELPFAGHPTLAAAFTVHVKDRFGDYGLVGALVCTVRDDVVQADIFLLSCRVLGRGVEDRMLAHIGQLAVERGIERVRLLFRP